MEYFITWWNVENLFDVENSMNRLDKLKEMLAKELEGWSEDILQKKITQLSDIIKSMNDEEGPDFIGVCEVENKPVLEQLKVAIDKPGRNYDIIHHDCSDRRGIDVAFIYDTHKFSKGEEKSHVILLRKATRNIYQVNLTTVDGNNELIIFGNHWPTRTGPTGMEDIYFTEPYRIVAAETLAYWHDQIVNEKGNDIPILVMGDFNDEPFNRSLVKYALSTREKQKVINAKTKPYLYNLMWEEMGKNNASFYFANFPKMIDQILISKGFFNGNFSIKDGTVKVYCPPHMVIQNDYKIPRRFGRPSANNLDEQGYSDHFPICMVIKEE